MTIKILGKEIFLNYFAYGVCETNFLEGDFTDAIDWFGNYPYKLSACPYHNGVLITFDHHNILTDISDYITPDTRIFEQFVPCHIWYEKFTGDIFDKRVKQKCVECTELAEQIIKKDFEYYEQCKNKAVSLHKHQIEVINRGISALGKSIQLPYTDDKELINIYTSSSWYYRQHREPYHYTGPNW